MMRTKGKAIKWENIKIGEVVWDNSFATVFYKINMTHGLVVASHNLWVYRMVGYVELIPPGEPYFYRLPKSVQRLWITE